MIFEIIFSIIGDVLFDHTLNTKKIDKHIEKLRNYKWFSDLYDDEKYHRLFFVSRPIRKFLQSRIRTKRLIKYSKAQNAFKSLLDKQLGK